MTLRRATTKDAVQFWSFVDRVTDRVLASDEFHGGSVTLKVGDRVETRDHESYVVRVKGRGLYWPRVSALRSAPSVPQGGEETT